LIGKNFQVCVAGVYALGGWDKNGFLDKVRVPEITNSSISTIQIAILQDIILSNIVKFPKDP